MTSTKKIYITKHLYDADTIKLLIFQFKNLSAGLLPQWDVDQMSLSNRSVKGCASDWVECWKPTNQRANWERPSVCLAIPTLTALRSSVKDTLKYNRDCAYANDFPSRLRTSTWANWGSLLKRQQALWGGVTLAARLSGIRTLNGHV